MIDTKGRRLIDKPVNYLAGLLHKAKLTPDQVTIMAFVIGILASICIALDYMVIAVSLLWLSGLFDVLDGQLARISNKTSKSGALLDMILDRMVEAFFVLGMVISNQNLAISAILFLITVIFNFSTFLAAGALIENQGKKSMHYDVGLIERTETFIFLTLIALIPEYRIVLMSFLTILIVITGVRRFHKIYLFLKD